MAIVMTEAALLLAMSLAKSAFSEGIFWSQNRTEEEIKARAASEEARTEELMARMRGGG